MSKFIDNGDFVAIGDLDVIHEECTELLRGNGFEMVVTDERDADGDHYNGTDHICVIKRQSDEELFGYSYYRGGGKYGQLYAPSNGVDYGLNEEEAEDRYGDKSQGWYVFTPVKQVCEPAYRFVTPE